MGGIMQIHYSEWLKRKFSEDNVCTCCGQRVFPGAGLYTVKHIGRSTVQLVMCSERCNQDFYLESLNRSGRESAPCDFDTLH
jgi:ribosomal protein L24E